MNTEKLFPWLPQDERLKPFYEGIIEFVTKYINLSSPKRYKHSKEILDPVVGYVKIYSWEMAMLDTLLFQRLRKITQLGLANLVYPSLNYTRFEHTIGTIGRLNQVLTRLRECHKPGEYENEKINVSTIDKYETQIRLAALFHDVGHCMFSHLTEFAMNELKGGKYKRKYTDEVTGEEKEYTIDYPSVEIIESIFNDEFAKEKDKLRLFEIFSITILGTRQVAEILFSNNIALFTYKDGEKIKNIEELGSVLEHVARFIAGLPIENTPETIFLAQLMSSGLDVDKLDYMSREEHFSGIKIEMDLQRIFNKINIFSISSNKLPESLEKYTKHIHPKHNEQNIAEEFIILGIEKGGQYSYEEFCMARLSLYEKIYLHKKVRAAEAFLKKKLTEFVAYDHEYQQAHKWLYLPESIIEEKLPYKIEKEVIVEGELFPRPETIQENIKFSDIIERKIPDRAFGFGPANSKTDSSVKNEKGELLSENELNNIHSIALWKSLMGTGNAKVVDSLRKSILKEAENISTFVLDHDLNFEDSVIRNEEERKIIEETLVFDIPDWKRVRLNPQTLYFKDAGFNTINWTIPVDRIHTYYQLHRILAYIYVNYKFCPLIYLATERVLYKYKIDNKLTNFVFDQTQAVSNSVYEKAEEIKQELCKQIISKNKHYYSDYEDLIPLDETLTTSFAIEKIQSVIRILGNINCKKNRNLSTLDVERFLKQFDRAIQLPMLHLISNIKVLSPENELPEKIKDIRKKIDEDKKIGVLPLGDFMNSSSNLLKNLKDTFLENNITSFNVNSEIIKNLDYILVIDDNINTGIQCLNIMMRYLGYDKTNILEEKQKELWMDLESKRGDIQEGIKTEFSEELKKKKFEFLFIAGHETSAETLKSYLKDYCKLKLKDFNITIIHTLKDNDKILSSEYGGYSEKSIFGDIKKNFDKNVTKRDETQKMLNILKEVGIALVKKKNIVTKHKQKPADNALGYRNRENLVVFANSVPTMTYTALWCEGKYDKKDWYPLIPRK
jgi:HD superfamily phosphohydrolase